MCLVGGCSHEQEEQSDYLVRSHGGFKSQTRRLTQNAAAAGAAHGFGRAAAANLREKDDSWNPAIGGFLSGAIVGLRCEVSAFNPRIYILNGESWHYANDFRLWCYPGCDTRCL